jgi:hypothetical protein
MVTPVPGTGVTNRTAGGYAVPGTGVTRVR